MSTAAGYPGATATVISRGTVPIAPGIRLRETRADIIPARTGSMET